MEVLWRLKDLGISVFIITAQSAAYIMNFVDPSIFARIIRECNVDWIEPNREVLQLMDLETMLPFQVAVEKYIMVIGWSSIVNPKRARFAVETLFLSSISVAV
jgi:hypothetical protein